MIKIMQSDDAFKMLRLLTDVRNEMTNQAVPFTALQDAQGTVQYLNAVLNCMTKLKDALAKAEAVART